MSATPQELKDARIPAEMMDVLKSMFEGIVTEKIESNFRQQNEAQAERMEKLMAGFRPQPAEAKPRDKSVFAGKLIRAIASSPRDPERAIKEAKRLWGDEGSEDVVKALAAGSASAGGFIVPPEYSSDIIDLLYNRTAVRQLGARVVPMQGTVSVPKLTGGGTAYYTGENANITPSEQTFGMLNLTAKTLAALVPISNSLLRWSSPSADSIVRDDLVTQMAVREDLAFIRGDGVSNTPKGIRYWINTTNAFGTAGTSLANQTTDLGGAVLKLENANVPMTTMGWMMAPRTWNTLMTQRDTNGNYAWREEMVNGRLWGWPFVRTNQIPTNLGGGSETELYLVDFAQAVIGESTDLVVDASSEAAYYDGSAVQAAFSRDQTVIRVIAQHDFGMRYDLGAAVVTAVAY